MKQRNRPTPRKAMTVGQMMGQGVSPSIEATEKSVGGLMKQGKAPTFPGQGHRSVKSLERQ
jgi:hypothetical protein